MGEIVGGRGGMMDTEDRLDERGHERVGGGRGGTLCHQ